MKVRDAPAPESNYSISCPICQAKPNTPCRTVMGNSHMGRLWRWNGIILHRSRYLNRKL